MTARGETLQIPTTRAVEKHFPVPGNGMARVRAEPRAAPPEETSPPPAQPSPARSGRRQLRDAQVI